MTFMSNESTGISHMGAIFLVNFVVLMISKNCKLKELAFFNTIMDYKIRVYTIKNSSFFEQSKF